MLLWWFCDNVVVIILLMHHYVSKSVINMWHLWFPQGNGNQCSVNDWKLVIWSNWFLLSFWFQLRSPYLVYHWGWLLFEVTAMTTSIYRWLYEIVLITYRNMDYKVSKYTKWMWSRRSFSIWNKCTITVRRSELRILIYQRHAVYWNCLSSMFNSIWVHN